MSGYQETARASPPSSGPCQNVCKMDKGGKDIGMSFLR
jgi:hypothetical protein